jgi:hypothetical protein
MAMSQQRSMCTLANSLLSTYALYPVREGATLQLLSTATPHPVLLSSAWHCHACAGPSMVACTSWVRCVQLLSAGEAAGQTLSVRTTLCGP